MGFNQLDPEIRMPSSVPKLSHAEIESAVTRALQEELSRLDDENAKAVEAETATPGQDRASEG